MRHCEELTTTTRSEVSEDAETIPPTPRINNVQCTNSPLPRNSARCSSYSLVAESVTVEVSC